MFPVIFLTANFGLRRSEVIALEWKAVDFEHKTFTVQKTISKVTEEVIKETTKTKSSHRILPIPDHVISFLRELKKQQLIGQVALGENYIHSDWVCRRKNGDRFKCDSVTRRFSQLLKKNNLPKITFHELRHSFASILLSDGESLKMVSDILGHSSISITADTYGHLTADSKRCTLDRFSQCLQETS